MNPEYGNQFQVELHRNSEEPSEVVKSSAVVVSESFNVKFCAIYLTVV